MSRARPWRLVALAYLAVVVAGIVVFRSAVSAQADAVVVLGVALEAPVVSPVVERLTDEPRVEETRVAGMPTTVVSPRGASRSPAIVFLNGATARGRHHPRVQGLARGFARAGHLALVPDLPGLRAGEITTRTLEAALAVVREARRRPDAQRGRLALVGVSVGATLALLVAEDRELGGSLSVVAGVAPWADLESVYRLATTGHYEEDGRLVRYETDPFLLVAAARSLAAALPPSRDRSALLSILREVDETQGEVVLAPPGPLGSAAEAVVALLANRDPGRFDELYRALPASIHAAHRRLSPVVGAARLRVPVELASAPEDEYFPVAESRDLAERAPGRVRVTVTRTLEHAIPELSARDLADLARFDAFAVRVLEQADG